MMPVYTYKCLTCEYAMRVFFPMGSQTHSVACEITDCGGRAERFFTAPFLVTQPHHLRAENNLYPGMGDKEITEERKKEDKQYYDKFVAPGVPDMTQNNGPVEDTGPTLEDAFAMGLLKE
jgi:hypothetical protein